MRIFILMRLLISTKRGGGEMKIKICCESLRVLVEEDYIRFKTLDKKEVVIDTAPYKEDEVEMKYCLFCGKKIKIVKRRQDEKTNKK